MDSLRSLIQLEQQRERLQFELSTVLKKVELLQLALFAPIRNALYSPVRSSPQPPPTARRRPLRRTPRGELRNKLFNLLTEAGHEGIRVSTTAALLGINAVNIHSWFHSAMRRYPDIEKVAAGHYRLKTDPTLAERKESPDKLKIRGTTRMRPKRGETTRRILNTLLEAGGSGIAAREIAKKIGSHYRNVHVWFASTGKKTNQVERIARGIYRIKQSTQVKESDATGNYPETNRVTTGH